MLIRFMGMICHIERGGTTGSADDVAVLIKAPAHLPRLRVPKRHIFGNPPDAPGTECFNLVNHTVTFSLEAGVADRTALAGTVPSLTTFGGSGTVHPNIIGKVATDLSDGIESIITLPAGRYGIEDFFPFRGTLPVGDVCIARTVVYDVNLDGATVVTISGIPGGPIDLKPTAIITITNLEPRPIPAANHFPQYGQVFSPPKTITTLASTTVSCPQGTDDYAYPICEDEGFMNIGVECTNSGYP